ncbi:MAG: NAD(P)-dependent oxidoreductase [Gammaproteobacteria bacterium]
MKINNVSFIGLGVMGYPMARHLAIAGFNTNVYNRTESKAQDWASRYSGTWSATPKEAAQGSDVVAVCVGNDEDVRSVIFGQHGALAGMKAETILIDHTTTSAELAEELAAACQAQGVHFMDAPVSGGQTGAENGTLTIMCGGEPSVFEASQPVINSYAKHATLLGGHGQGQRCKMVNQICIAGILQGLSEAMLLAQKAGLDIEQVVQVLKHGAADSWQLENRAVTLSQGKFDFGFAIDWMRKDLGICLQEAKKHGLTLPMTEEVDGHYQTLQSIGLGRLDTSALIKAYQHEA